MDGVGTLARITHYERLGVPPTATLDEIHHAYLAMARRYHPDAAGSGDGAAMASVNAAWHELSDPVRRARYDRTLASTAPPRAPIVVTSDDDDWLVDDDDSPLGPDAARAALGLGCLVGVTAIVVVLALIALFIYAFFRSPVS